MILPSLFNVMINIGIIVVCVAVSYVTYRLTKKSTNNKDSKNV